MGLSKGEGAKRQTRAELKGAVIAVSYDLLHITASLRALAKLENKKPVATVVPIASFERASHILAKELPTGLYATLSLIYASLIQYRIDQDVHLDTVSHDSRVFYDKMFDDYIQTYEYLVAYAQKRLKIPGGQKDEPSRVEPDYFSDQPAP